MEAFDRYEENDTSSTETDSDVSGDDADWNQRNHANSRNNRNHHHHHHHHHGYDDSGEPRYATATSSSTSFMSTSSGCSFSERDNKKTFLTKNLLLGLDRLRQEGRFSDITLKVNDVCIPAHKNILCAYSPYFNAMFTGYFKEINDNTIIMEDLDPDALQILIDYLYTGKLYLTQDNVQNILDTAHFLQIDPAQESCCRFISKSINEKNCIEFIAFAGKYGNKSLLKKAIRKTVTHFFKLYGSEELLNIEIHEFKILISTINMNKYPRCFLFDLIIRWVKKLPQERLKYLNELISDHINPCDITKEQLMSSRALIEESISSTLSVSTHSLSEKCKQSWLDKFDIQKNSLVNRILVCNRLSKYPAFVYDTDSNSTIALSHGLRFNPGSSYLCHNNTLYVHGGWKSKGTYVDETFCYDIFQNQCKKFIPLQIARAYHRTCVLNEYLYVVGGGFTTRALDCVEAVDLSTGNSIKLNNLMNARSSMGISTYANSIYVVAGINAEENLVTIERFDPREGEWKLLPKRCYGYGECSTTVINDNMYCVTGLGKSMERYDFRMDEWTLIKTQRDSYPNELFQMDNKLHGVFPENIAEYDSVNGVWNSYYDLQTISNYTIANVVAKPEEEFLFKF